jgi:large subunit ribosomal protein L21
MRARPVAQRRVDDLTRVNGNGPVYARRLKEAGIATFAALAATPAEELAAIVQLQEWQAAYPGDWITQAAAFAVGG